MHIIDPFLYIGIKYNFQTTKFQASYISDVYRNTQIKKCIEFVLVLIKYGIQGACKFENRKKNVLNENLRFTSKEQKKVLGKLMKGKLTCDKFIFSEVDITLINLPMMYPYFLISWLIYYISTIAT